MEARVYIPTDPERRRQLWLEWIHTDTPRADRVVRTAPSKPADEDWLPEVIDAPASVVHGLKRAIAECIVGGTLSIVDRQRLIARSMKLGLNRFEANLLIAAVQNRCRAAEDRVPTLPRPMRWGMGTLLLALLLAEAVAVSTWAIYFLK